MMSFQFEVTTSPQQITGIPSGSIQDQMNYGIQVPSGAVAGIYVGGPGVATGGSSCGWFVDKGQSFTSSLVNASSSAPWVVGTAASVFVTVLVNN